MPSEKSRYIFNKPTPTASFGREETIAVLESQGARALAEHVWQRSEMDNGLRHQLAVMVLKSRLRSNHDENAIKNFLGQLVELCSFEADWEECEDGWALFLAEVVTALETLLERTPLDSVSSQIQDIIRACPAIGA